MIKPLHLLLIAFILFAASLVVLKYRTKTDLIEFDPLSVNPLSVNTLSVNPLDYISTPRNN